MDVGAQPLRFTDMLAICSDLEWRRERLHMADDGFNYAFRAILNWQNVEQFKEATDWCRERFGEVCSGHARSDSWYVHDSTIWFVREEHAVEFKLRWL
jgi:hypothetical protein